MTEKLLIEKALKATENSYSPYSGFKVGAALLCEDGEIYCGCNIENASFSATVCAERVAISKAVSEGKAKFKAIAVVGGKNGEITDYCTPCGICRQVLSEFCEGDFKIILFNGDTIKVVTLNEILPLGFGSENLCL